MTMVEQIRRTQADDARGVHTKAPSASPATREEKEKHGKIEGKIEHHAVQRRHRFAEAKRFS